MELKELRDTLYPIFKIVEKEELDVGLEYTVDSEMRFTIYVYPTDKWESKEDYHVMSLTNLNEDFYTDITEFLVEAIVWKRLTYDKQIENTFKNL